MILTALLAAAGWYFAVVFGAYAVIYRRRWKEAQRRRLLGSVRAKDLLVGSFTVAVLGAAADAANSLREGDR